MITLEEQQLTPIILSKISDGYESEYINDFIINFYDKIINFSKLREKSIHYINTEFKFIMYYDSITEKFTMDPIINGTNLVCEIDFVLSVKSKRGVIGNLIIDLYDGNIPKDEFIFKFRRYIKGRIKRHLYNDLSSDSNLEDVIKGNCTIDRCINRNVFNMNSDFRIPSSIRDKENVIKLIFKTFILEKSHVHTLSKTLEVVASINNTDPLDYLDSHFKEEFNEYKETIIYGSFLYSNILTQNLLSVEECNEFIKNLFNNNDIEEFMEFTYDFEDGFLNKCGIELLSDYDDHSMFIDYYLGKTITYSDDETSYSSNRFDINKAMNINKNIYVLNLEQLKQNLIEVVDIASSVGLINQDQFVYQSKFLNYINKGKVKDISEFYSEEYDQSIYNEMLKNEYNRFKVCRIKKDLLK